jgi:hydroxyacylglutathione hydrolase
MKGILAGGFEHWKKAGEPIDLIINVEAEELAVDLPFDPRLLVIDVRRETEFADGHIRGAVNIPVSELTDPGTMANIEDTHNVYVHCAGGYRSIIASSMLKRQGIHNLRNITGGWKSISEQPNIEIVKENSVLN